MGLAVGVAEGVPVAVGAGVGEVATGVGVGVGLAVGVEVGLGVGVEVGFGAGAGVFNQGRHLLEVLSGSLEIPRHDFQFADGVQQAHPRPRYVHLSRQRHRRHAHP